MPEDARLGAYAGRCCSARRLQSTALHDRAVDIFVHYAKIVILAEDGNLIAGLGQTPGDFFIRVLSASTKPRSVLRAKAAK